MTTVFLYGFHENISAYKKEKIFVDMMYTE